MKSQITPNFDRALSQFMGNDMTALNPDRSKALKRFLAQGFPTRHEENWKYTDLSFLANEAFAYPENTQVTADMQLQGFKVKAKQMQRLTFIDGYFSPAFSSLDQIASQCQILSLTEALNTHPALVKKYLHPMQTAQMRLLDLNDALMTDGFFIAVPDHAIIKTPLHILFIHSAQNHPSMCYGRNIIELGTNSQLTVFEEHLDLSSMPTMKNNITQIKINAGASLDIYKLQNQNHQALHIAQTLIEQERDSCLTSFTVTLGARLSRDDLNVALQAPGASCLLQGLYLGDGDQHLDHHTRIDHLMPHGTSREHYQGILSGKSTGVFNGKVIVHPHAQKTSSQQTNKNLLLSKHAQADTKPELEIYADDVACAHGATVGQINPESLFYLRSRGLDKPAAMALLIDGFADEILAAFKHSEIMQYVRTAVHEKMSASFVSGLGD